MWKLASGGEPYSDYEIDNEDELIRDIVDGVRPNRIIGIPECYHELMQKCLDSDPEKRPTTQNIPKVLEKFKTSLNKQFDNVDQKIRDQPLELDLDNCLKVIS
jgi:serine/threonine protein kinase